MLKKFIFVKDYMYFIVYIVNGFVSFPQMNKTLIYMFAFDVLLSEFFF